MTPADFFAIMHAPMHAPSVRLRHIRHMFRIAKRRQVVSIGMTEAYNALGYLRLYAAGWRVIRGKSKTDTRRGPKDNPILLRRRYRGRRVKLLKTWTIKAHGPSEPERLAPERWITAVLFRCWDGNGWMNVLHVAVHPNAAVMRAVPTVDRVEKYRDFWRQVVALVEGVEETRGPFHVVLTGDVNATESYDAHGWPAWAVERLNLSAWWERIDLVAHSSQRLEAFGREKYSMADNGQDHPWMVESYALK